RADPGGLPRASPVSHQPPPRGGRRVRPRLPRQTTQRLEVHDGVDGLAAVRHEAALRHATVERHLPALEAAARPAARPGPLALVALRGRLAVAGAGPASDPLAPLRGAWRWAQLVKLHESPRARGAPSRSCRAR